MKKILIVFQPIEKREVSDNLLNRKSKFRSAEIDICDLYAFLNDGIDLFERRRKGCVVKSCKAGNDFGVQMMEERSK